MTQAPHLTLVLPVRDEEGTIEKAVTRSIETLDGLCEPGGYELLIVENGSTDDTLSIARRLGENHYQVSVLSREVPGRGGALNAAFEQAAGETICYIDADLAVDLGHLEELIESVRVEGYDIATGSRYLPESRVSRTIGRAVLSRVFNFAVSRLLDSSIRDHQCGFKAFNRDVILELIPKVKDTKWFWDTEVLVRAQWRGHRVKEFSVEWESQPDSKVQVLPTVIQMGLGIVACWLEKVSKGKDTRYHG